MQLHLLFSVILPALSFAVYLQNSSDKLITETKLVIAHFIVGNTYPYTVDDWTRDIELASSKGFDAFALNVGGDPWQPGKVADAYEAAKMCNEKGIYFKLFLSFDMNSLPCSQPADAAVPQSYIKTYALHPNQLLYNNKTFVSTFAGDSCTFGMDSVNAGWQFAVKSGPTPVHFVPAFFDVNSFPSMLDGAFSWNAGWPMDDNDINFDSDNLYRSNLGGRSYMASVSPWFFTHYGPDSYNKNFIYRADDWLLVERWELLVNNRNDVDLAQLISWNDYGESHYIGPIEGDQPNSQAWTNGFNHEDWLDLITYYIKAFKTGSYPAVTRDRVFLWARLYPAVANAPDNVGRPTNWQFTQDYLWVVVFLTVPADVILSCGSTNQTTSLPKGVSKLKMPLASASTCAMGAVIRKKGRATLNFSPANFSFSSNPPSYNFNAFVAASP